jgi:anthranilate synthase component 2
LIPLNEDFKEPNQSLALSNEQPRNIRYRFAAGPVIRTISSANAPSSARRPQAIKRAHDPRHRQLRQLHLEPRPLSEELGAEVEVVRNDAIGVGQAMSLAASAFLISPGPCTPNEAGISLDLVAACAAEKRPLLGVCLGHQAIGQHFGGSVVRAQPDARQDLARAHDGTGVFEYPLALHRDALSFADRRGHSRRSDRQRDADDGTVMGFRHATLPIHGVQFHPESIATEHGHDLLANFMALTGIPVSERA